jgi:hypothetical protein
LPEQGRNLMTQISSFLFRGEYIGTKRITLAIYGRNEPNLGYNISNIPVSISSFILYLPDRTVDDFMGK